MPEKLPKYIVPDLTGFTVSALHPRWPAELRRRRRLTRACCPALQLKPFVAYQVPKK